MNIVAYQKKGKQTPDERLKLRVNRLYFLDDLRVARLPVLLTRSDLSQPDSHLVKGEQIKDQTAAVRLRS